MKDELNRLITHSKNNDTGKPVLSIEECEKVAKEYAEIVLNNAIEMVGGEIVFNNLKAEGEFNAMIDYDKFKKGVDYDIKLNPQDILEFKKLV